MTDKLAPLLKEVTDLEKKVASVNLPAELQEKTLIMIQRLGRMIRFGEYSTEYEKTAHYVDWVANLPWANRSQDVLELPNAKKILDKNHYGLVQIKERVLEYLSVLSLRKGKNEFQRAPILCFVGLVGTGKTTIASSIAEAMGRKFARIPFGGLGDPLDLRGQSRLRPDAEPSLVIKALRRTGTKNPVILLD
ncbi:AAA family ATPase [Patescibacteria group bacterium]|nr:AAA family ATPase [Patescibacteria group bacterium]